MPDIYDRALREPIAHQPETAVRRRLPVGAEYQGDGKTHVRVWAPSSSSVVAALENGQQFALADEGRYYFSGTIDASPGDRYGFLVGGNTERRYPDPASRFQPEGPHGPSEVVDPASFAWTDYGWKGASPRGQVIYELHIGTFTREGSFAAAAARLPALADLGVTIIEIMPIAEFDGRFGWGYDGVDLYAPSHRYGRPDDVRRFVDLAHAHGLAVVLDVVYNHFGPSGNYLRVYSTSYFTDRYENEWGDAVNFDGADADPVREFFVANAGYWIDEFHFDGLRFDATQQIFDTTAEHILAAMGRRARQAAGERSIVLIAESERQDARLVRPLEEGGFGLDAVWNDDFHHSALVALTGRGEAYYSDTLGAPQEFISAAKYGYLFQGQEYEWQRKPRGVPTWGLPPSAFVTFLENHDQVANSARGLRGHQLTSPAKWRAMTAWLLLAPGTPMLFQGQEMASSAPFLYFADFEGDLAEAIRKGRGEFLTQFPNLLDVEARDLLDDPGNPATFERCKLDWREAETHSAAYALHADLLHIRREHPAFSVQVRPPGGPGTIDGCVLSEAAFALRYFTPGHRDDRVVIVNLGHDVRRGSFPEPLLAPPEGTDWIVSWSSEDPRYGGTGTRDLWPDGAWRISGEMTVVIAPGPQRPQRPGTRRRTA
jgi:maltooligosyltrehalose trehalohydrolase